MSTYINMKNNHARGSVTGSQFNGTIIGSNISNFTSTGSRKGGSISVSGNRAVINGIDYVLPQYRSISICDGDIVLDGVRWNPPNKRNKSNQGPLMPFDVVHEEIDHGPYHVVDGFDKVTLIEGSVFRVHVKGMMYGTDMPKMTLSRVQSELDNEDGRVESSEIEITIPQEGLSLECNYARTVQAANLDRPTLTLICPTVDSLVLTFCKVKEVRSKNAQINWRDVTCQHLTANTTSNDVRMVNCSVEEGLYISTVSGNVLADNCTITEAMKARTTSGYVHVEQCIIGTFLNVSTTSGNVHVEKSAILRSLTVDTSTGIVKIFGTVESQIQVGTVSGNVHLIDFSGKGGSIRTTAGHVSVCQNGTVDSLYVSTTSGNLSGSGNTRPTFSTTVGQNTFKVTQKI